MQGEAGTCVLEQGDQTLDLPPAAEVDQIAGIAAAVCAIGGFAGSILAQPIDQLAGVGDRAGIGKVNVMLQRLNTPAGILTVPSL